MDFPYTYVFGGLLVAYMVYSQWVGLDSRYPIGAALVLLVGAAVLDASGATGAASTLSVFVFLLLAAGVILLLIDHVRAARRASRLPVAGPSDESKAPEAADQGEAAAEDPLHGLEEQLVSRVHAARQKHHQREQPRDREHDDG